MDDEGKWEFNHKSLQGLFDAEIVTIEVAGNETTPDVAMLCRPETVRITGMSGLSLKVLSNTGGHWVCEPEATSL